MMADEPALPATSVATERRTSSTGFVVIQSFDSYPAAQDAVDLLVDRGFPVEHLAVVARELVMVEEVTGRRTIWRAACGGSFSVLPLEPSWARPTRCRRPASSSPPCWSPLCWPC